MISRVFVYTLWPEVNESSYIGLMTDFLKMHGCGNDFIVIDARKTDMRNLLSNPSMISMLCDRHIGIGCDQLIVIGPTGKADVEMIIRNADGSTAGMCGNAVRCVADIIIKETSRKTVTILVGDRLLECAGAGDLVTVDMGAPAKTGTADVGLDLNEAITVDVGNPHAVFFVDDADAIDLQGIGPKIEHHKLFPNRINVEFVSKRQDGLRMRVWERGAGITLACGSGACATAYAAFAQGHAGRKTRIHMDGGTLNLEIREGDGHILMTGPVTYVFKGSF